MICNYSAVDLSQNNGIFKILIEGQKFALSKFGLENVILTQTDLQVEDGTYGIIASLPSGEIIGGLRIYTRAYNRSLPLESASSITSEYDNNRSPY